MWSLLLGLNAAAFREFEESPQSSFVRFFSYAFQIGTTLTWMLLVEQLLQAQ